MCFFFLPIPPQDCRKMFYALLKYRSWTMSVLSNKILKMKTDTSFGIAKTDCTIPCNYIKQNDTATIHLFYCSWYRTVSSDWHTRELCCHSEGPWRAGEIGREESHEVQFNRGRSKVLSLQSSNTRHQHTLAAGWLGSTLAENGLGVLVGNKWTTSQQ